MKIMWPKIYSGIDVSKFYENTGLKYSFEFVIAFNLPGYTLQTQAKTPSTRIGDVYVVASIGNVSHVMFYWK